MNQSLLTLGIILSLGTFGCAGFGMQSNSSLAASYATERGVDDLWAETEPAPSGGVEPTHYADQSLGTLWDTTTAGSPGELQAPSGSARSGDLWNSASVTYTWAPSEDVGATKPRGLFGKARQPTRY